MDYTITEGEIRHHVQHLPNGKIKACCELHFFGAPERIKFFNVGVFNKFFGWFKTEEAFHAGDIKHPNFLDGLYLFCDELD